MPCQSGVNTCDIMTWRPTPHYWPFVWSVILQIPKNSATLVPLQTIPNRRRAIYSTNAHTTRSFVRLLLHCTGLVMFRVYFHLCCRWPVEAWSKWQISYRRHSQLHCLWTNSNAYSRISLIFVPEGSIDKYWNNCERTISVIKGNIPGTDQYWPNGISVWFWHMYMFTGSIHLTYFIPGNGGAYILVD